MARGFMAAKATVGASYFPPGSSVSEHPFCITHLKISPVCARPSPKIFQKRKRRPKNNLAEVNRRRPQPLNEIRKTKSRIPRAARTDHQKRSSEAKHA